MSRLPSMLMRLPHDAPNSAAKKKNKKGDILNFDIHEIKNVPFFPPAN